MIPRIHFRWLLACLTMLVLGVLMTTCTSGDAPIGGEPAVVEVSQETTVVETATAAPTVSVPTRTPTPSPGPPTPVPTLVVVPTDTPLPEPVAQTYVVEQFDTLLDIAIKFDTTTEAIAAANGMAVDDFLQVGQELIIPAPTETSGAAAVSTSSGDQAMSGTTAESRLQNANVAQTGTGSTQSSPIPAPAAPAQTAKLPPAPVVSLPDNINPLTGLPVDDPAKLRRRPLLVRIGNDVGARVSQVGLNKAEMVYEEIAEWWVTRFTAIFLSEAPNTVGPVRSSRLVNVQLAPQYQGALAHSGGSDAVRWEISQAPIANLDEYFNPAPYFYRPNEGWQTRLAIDAQAARDYIAAKKLDAPVKLPGFVFSDTIAEGEPGADIYIPYPQATSFTEWHYDNASGTYLRWIKGSPLYDAGSGQVTASNVIVYFAEHQATDIVEDANGATSIRIIVNGSGPAWFFRDGKLNKGSWYTDGSRPPYFTYADGQPYPLKPGNTWVELVPTYFKIGINSVDEASSRP